MTNHPHHGATPESETPEQTYNTLVRDYMDEKSFSFWYELRHKDHVNISEAYHVARLSIETKKTKPLKKDPDKLVAMLEDVVTALDLSDSAFEKHGPLGTEPAELVKLVLDQKDKEIRMLKQGFTDVSQPTEPQAVKKLKAVIAEREKEITDLKEWFQVATNQAKKYYSCIQEISNQLHEKGIHHQASMDLNKDFEATIEQQKKEVEELKQEFPETHNWYGWLCARIPNIKEGANKFWINQALQGYADEQSKNEYNKGFNAGEQAHKHQ